MPRDGVPTGTNIQRGANIMLNVGFDMDGVLVDSQPIFQTLIYNKFKTYDMEAKDNKGNILFSYHIDGVPRAEIWELIHEGLKYYQPFMSSVNGMKEELEFIWLAQEKRPIQIISARPEDCFVETNEWLMRHTPVPYNLYVVDPPKNGVGEKNVKTDLVNDLKLSHFVEDRFKYASEIAAQCPNIQKVFLLNREYNKGRRVRDKVHRIDHFYQILTNL